MEFPESLNLITSVRGNYHAKLIPIVIVQSISKSVRGTAGGIHLKDQVNPTFSATKLRLIHHNQRTELHSDYYAHCCLCQPFS